MASSLKPSLVYLQVKPDQPIFFAKYRLPADTGVEQVSQVMRLHVVMKHFGGFHFIRYTPTHYLVYIWLKLNTIEGISLSPSANIRTFEDKPATMSLINKLNTTDLRKEHRGILCKCSPVNYYQLIAQLDPESPFRQVTLRKLKKFPKRQLPC